MPDHLDDVLDRCRHGKSAAEWCEECDALIDLTPGEHAAARVDEDRR